MSVALAEPADLTYATEDDRPVRPALRVVEPLPSPGRTTTRRPGPGVGPSARPRRLRFVAPPPARSSSCRPPAPLAAAAAVAPRPTAWRLTERGVAVVLVVAAALVAASVAVVALTALRVTGESYHPGHVAPVPVVAQP